MRARRWSPQKVPGRRPNGMAVGSRPLPLHMTSAAMLPDQRQARGIQPDNPAPHVRRLIPQHPFRRAVGNRCGLNQTPLLPSALPRPTPHTLQHPHPSLARSALRGFCPRAPHARVLDKLSPPESVNSRAVSLVSVCVCVCVSDRSRARAPTVLVAALDATDNLALQDLAPLLQLLRRISASRPATVRGRPPFLPRPCCRRTPSPALRKPFAEVHPRRNHVVRQQHIRGLDGVVARRHRPRQRDDVVASHPGPRSPTCSCTPTRTASW